MKVTRSLFGDILHGNSHFIDFPYKVGEVTMKGEQDFAYGPIYPFGIIADTNVDPESEDKAVAKMETLKKEIEYLKDTCE
jgi:hypothetical protein